MIWWFYNCLFPVVYLLMLPRFLVRMYRRGGYRRGFLQRLALYERPLRERLQGQGRIWVHAVSVGEVLVALRFMAAYRARRPGAAFILTTATSTGHAVAAKQLAPADVLLYFPADFPPVIRRAIRILNPLALVLVESELWPNLIRQMQQGRRPIMLLNARLSDRSYRRYRQVRFLTRPLLALIDLFCVPGLEERTRLIALGAPPQHIHITGSAKYDVAAAAAKGAMPRAELLQRAGFENTAHLLVGGSTWPGEETILLELYQNLRQQHPQARLVLAPRHMERAAAIVHEIEKSGLNYRRWSSAQPSQAPAVLLVDTTGELRHFYAAATAIFVGKSLTAHGGQNIIEPAVFAKPIIIGPHMENFRSVTADFLAAQALIQVQDKEGLERALTLLWTEEAERRAYGDRAQRLVQTKAGSIAAGVDLFLALIAAAPSGPARSGQSAQQTTMNQERLNER